MQLILSVVASLLLAVVSSFPICPLCDPASCGGQPLDCPGGIIRDSCGCCEICAKTIGEECSPGQCDAAAGLICIPDDPYAIVQTGLCQEFSTCLTFGCDVVNDQCQCRYSNTCPVYMFTYNNLDDCKEGLQRTQCETVECPQQDCPEGMIYDPGFATPGECCPTGGTCMCDYLQCKETSCPSGTNKTLIAAANESEWQCCDIFECQETELLSCQSGNDDMIPHNTEVQLDPCTTCLCYNGSLACIQETCPTLEYCESGQSFTPEGNCCPICFPMNILEPVPSEPPFSNCVAANGSLYSDGDVWKADKCTSCRCINGRSLCSSIQCEAINCRNPIFLPDVCCPLCPDEVWPSSSEIPSATTTSNPNLEPSPAMVVTIEIAIILDIPFDEYESEEPGLLQELKYLLGIMELDVEDMKASPYGDSQTYVMVLTSTHKADMSDKEVVSVISEGTQHNSMVYRVGTASEIPSDSELSSKGEEPEASRSNGDSSEDSIVTAVLVTVSLVSTISIVGSIIAAVIIIVRVRRQQAARMNSGKSAQTNNE